MNTASRTALTRGGVAVVLASATYLSFMFGWEGRGRTVYADRLAGGLPTACGGITKHTSPYPVVVGDVWSQARCDEVAAMVAERTQLTLTRCITGPITQGAFDALSSHAHNFGVANTCASRAMGLINAGRLAEGCRALANAPDGKPVWSYVDDGKGGKKFVPGLYSRRRAEAALCLGGPL